MRISMCYTIAVIYQMIYMYHFLLLSLHVVRNTWYIQSQNCSLQEFSPVFRDSPAVSDWWLIMSSTAFTPDLHEVKRFWSVWRRRPRPHPDVNSHSFPGICSGLFDAADAVKPALVYFNLHLMDIQIATWKKQKIIKAGAIHRSFFSQQDHGSVIRESLRYYYSFWFYF